MIGKSVGVSRTFTSEQETLVKVRLTPTLFDNARTMTFSKHMRGNPFWIKLLFLVLASVPTVLRK